MTLLSIAVLFACLLIQLKYAPKSIDWIGENISKRYASVHKHKMESALEKLDLGEELPSVNLLRSWINIKKGDRIFPHKRNLFIELAKRVRREKRYKDLLTLSELWIELDDRDKEICLEIGSLLKEKGQIFVGIDVIGGYLTEINVTSPTGIQELERFDNINIAEKIWKSIESKF